MVAHLDLFFCLPSAASYNTEHITCQIRCLVIDSAQVVQNFVPAMILLSSVSSEVFVVVTGVATVVILDLSKASDVVHSAVTIYEVVIALVFLH